MPHATLALLPDDTVLQDVLGAVPRAVEGWTPLPVVLAGFGVFPGPPPVVWVAPVVTASLLERHAELCEAVAAFGLHGHSRPGHWVPHITLCQGAASAARAIEVVSPLWNGPVTARFERIEIVRFPPVTVAWSGSLVRGSMNGA